MNLDPRQIVSRIGETDQLYLAESTAELALERADLRMQLTQLSQIKAERLHFLQEAIVLLEQARIEYEEMPLETYLDLSVSLAKAYMLYFEMSQEQRFALITQQILKPLAHHAYRDVYFMLAYAAAAKNEAAMLQHWTKKYLATIDADISLIRNHHAFASIQDELWFKDVIKNKIH